MPALGHLVLDKRVGHLYYAAELGTPLAREFLESRPRDPVRKVSH